MGQHLHGQQAGHHQHGGAADHHDLRHDPLVGVGVEQHVPHHQRGADHQQRPQEDRDLALRHQHAAAAPDLALTRGVPPRHHLLGIGPGRRLLERAGPVEGDHPPLGHRAALAIAHGRPLLRNDRPGVTDQLPLGALHQRALEVGRRLELVHHRGRLNIRLVRRGVVGAEAQEDDEAEQDDEAGTEEPEHAGGAVGVGEETTARAEAPDDQHDRDHHERRRDDDDGREEGVHAVESTQAPR